MKSALQTPPRTEPDEHRASFLNVRDLSKTFGTHRVLDHVRLEVRPGEVHALLGQNGSGKSTLIKVLAGIHEPDSGAVVEVDGSQVDLSGRSSHQSGFRFVHQDLGLIGQLSAAENLELTAARPRAWFSDRALRRRAEALMSRHGIRLDVATPVRDLSRAQQSLIAITRAIADLPTGQGLLVLDEPTASLPPADVAHLLDVIGAIARSGISILYVTHRMEEVFAAADRMTVLRDGRTVLTTATADITPDGLTDAITGAQTPATPGATVQVLCADSSVRDRATSVGGPPALRVESLVGRRVDDISFVAGAGETVGLTGLVGSGYEEALAYVFGTAKRDRGQVAVHGVAMPNGRCDKAVAEGIGYVPSDRDRLGSIPQWTIAENLTLPQIPRRGSGLLDRRRERDESIEWSERLDIVPPDVDRMLMELSGGNRQRVALGRWLRRGCRVLLLDEPTIGVDVGGKARIYAILRDAAQRGVALVVASSDHAELLEICDRILVMREGQIVAAFARGQATQEDLFRACVSAGRPGMATNVERDTDE